jgi:DNA-binding IclR family transcriptional regulator
MSTSSQSSSSWYVPAVRTGTGSVSDSGGPRIVEAVMRATHLLDCFRPGEPELTLAEFVRRGGYSKTTTYRLLTTLERAGWLERVGAGAFRLTIKPFQLGSILVDSLELRREAGPVMARLASEYDQTVYLIVPHGPNGICLERIDSGQAIRVMALEVGGLQAMHLGAGPRALLAYHEEECLPLLLEAGLDAATEFSITDPDQLRADLREVREKGYALSLEDMTVGVGAIGAPVFDLTGEAVASISIAGLAERYRPPHHEDMLAGLLGACRELSLRLGYRPAAVQS